MCLKDTTAGGGCQRLKIRFQEGIELRSRDSEIAPTGEPLGTGNLTISEKSRFGNRSYRGILENGKSKVSGNAMTLPIYLRSRDSEIAPTEEPLGTEHIKFRKTQ